MAESSSRTPGKKPVAQVQRAVEVEEKELFALKKIMVNHQSRFFLLSIAMKKNELTARR